MKWVIGVIGVMAVGMLLWAFAVTWNRGSDDTTRYGPAFMAFIPGIFLLAVDSVLCIFRGLWLLFTS